MRYLSVKPPGMILTHNETGGEVIQVTHPLVNTLFQLRQGANRTLVLCDRMSTIG